MSLACLCAVLRARIWQSMPYRKDDGVAFKLRLSGHRRRPSASNRSRDRDSVTWEKVRFWREAVGTFLESLESLSFIDSFRAFNLFCADCIKLVPKETYKSESRGWTAHWMAAFLLSIYMRPVWKLKTFCAEAKSSSWSSRSTMRALQSYLFPLHGTYSPANWYN